ncbi:MAG: HAMP domain-containing protein, partial [Hydrogenovibrio sp.]
MGIKTRMFIGILGAVLFLLASNLVAQYVFSQTSQAIHQIVNVNQVKVALLNDLKNLSDERAILSRDLVIVEDESSIQAVKARLKETAAEIADVFGALEKAQLDAKEQAYFDAIRENVVAANTVFGSFMMMVDEGFTEDAVEILEGEFGEKYKAFSDIVSEFKEYEDAKNTASVTGLVEQERFGTISLWLVLLVSVVIFSIAGWLVARSFMNPINAMRETMAQIIASGDLSHRVKVFSKDELGQTGEAINRLLKTIHDAIDDVNTVMHEVSGGSFKRQIEHDYQGDFLMLKQGVNQSVDQIHSMVLLLRETAHNLRNGVLQSAESKGAVLSGDYASVMNDLNVSMERIAATVTDISTTLDALSHGDFSQRVQAEARGEFVVLKDS